MSKKHAVRMKVAKGWFAASLLAVSVAVQASPTITSMITENGVVSGREGKILTLKGVGFGAQGPNIVVYEDFEGGTPGGYVPLGKAITGGYVYASPYTTPMIETAVNGSRAMSIRDLKHAPTSGYKYGRLQVDFAASNEIFINYDVMVPPGKTFPGASATRTFPSMSSWKFTWLQDGVKGGTVAGASDQCLPTHAGNGFFLLAGNDGNLASLGSGTKFWDWDGFSNFSLVHMADQAAPDSAPGKNIWRVTNQTFGSRVSDFSDRPSIMPGKTRTYNNLLVPGWSDNGDHTNANGHYDNLYVATGPRANVRVELTDQVGSSATTVGLGLPLSWNDTSVRVFVPNELIASKGLQYVRLVAGRNNLFSSEVALSSAVTATTQMPGTPKVVQKK